MCLSLRSISLTLSFSHQLPLLVSPLVSTCPLLRMISLSSLDSQQRKISLTITTRVEKMLSQVTAKHPFLLRLPLLWFLWAGLHQGTKEGDELAAFLWHCATKRRNQVIPVIPGLAQLDKAEHNTFYRAHQNGKNITNKYIQKWIFPIPGGVQGQVGWGPGPRGMHEGSSAQRITWDG